MGKIILKKPVLCLTRIDSTVAKSCGSVGSWNLRRRAAKDAAIIKIKTMYYVLKEEQQTNERMEKWTEVKKEKRTEVKMEDSTEVKMEERVEELTEVETEQGTEERMKIKTEPATEHGTEERMEIKTEPATEQRAEERAEQGTGEFYMCGYKTEPSHARKVKFRVMSKRLLYNVRPIYCQVTGCNAYFYNSMLFKRHIIAHKIREGTFEESDLYM